MIRITANRALENEPAKLDCMPASVLDPRESTAIARLRGF
jgi:hypothetical protein